MRSKFVTCYTVGGPGGHEAEWQKPATGDRYTHEALEVAGLEEAERTSVAPGGRRSGATGQLLLRGHRVSGRSEGEVRDTCSAAFRTRLTVPRCTRKHWLRGQMSWLRAAYHNN